MSPNLSPPLSSLPHRLSMAGCQCASTEVWWVLRSPGGGVVASHACPTAGPHASVAAWRGLMSPAWQRSTPLEAGRGSSGCSARTRRGRNIICRRTGSANVVAGSTAGGRIHGHGGRIWRVAGGFGERVASSSERMPQRCGSGERWCALWIGSTGHGWVR